MILNYIYLKNIRSYQESKVFFPRGSTVLSGDIGCGKSSILIAMEFALFGLQGKRLSASHLLRQGESEGIVELGLIVDGKDLIIRRTLKAGKNGISQTAGQLIDDGLSMDLTATEIKARVFEKLGYPKDHLTKSKNFIYRYTVYTPQEELKQILYEDQESRKESMRNIFQIDKYKNVKNNVGVIVKKIREEVLELKGRVHDVEQLKLKFENVKKTMHDEKSLLSQHTKELDIKKEEFSNMLMELDKFNEAKTKLNTINTKLNQIYDHKDNLSKQYQEISSRVRELEQKNNEIKNQELSITYNENLNFNEEQIQNEVFEIQSKIADMKKAKELEFSKRQNLLELNKAFNEFGEEQSTIKMKLENNRAQLLKFENFLKTKEAMDNKLEKEQKGYDRINEDFIKRKSELDSLQGVTSRLMSIDNCPTCLQPVGIDHKKTINAKNNTQIIELKNSLVDLERMKFETHNELKRLNIELKQFDEIKTNHSTYAKENEMLNERYRNIELKKDELYGKIEVLKGQLDSYVGSKLTKVSDYERDIEEKKQILLTIKKNKENRDKKKHLNEIFMLNERTISDNQKRMNEIEVELKKLKDEVLNLESERVNLSSSFEGIEDLQKKKLFYEESIGNINKAIAVGRSNINNYTNQLEELDQVISQKKETQKRVSKMQSIINFLNSDFVSLADNIERHLFSTIQIYFDEYFSHWFRLLIDDDNLSATIDDNFSPRIIQNGHETDFTNLSGGEKTALCLAYRLALNRVINNLVSNIKTKNIIVLDEPTDGFSSSQMDKIRDVLDELELEQIILVTHENKIESFVDNVLRVEKHNHISKVFES